MGMDTKTPHPSRSQSIKNKRIMKRMKTQMNTRLERIKTQEQEDKRDKKR